MDMYGTRAPALFGAEFKMAGLIATVTAGRMPVYSDEGIAFGVNVLQRTAQHDVETKRRWYINSPSNTECDSTNTFGEVSLATR